MSVVQYTRQPLKFAGHSGVNKYTYTMEITHTRDVTPRWFIETIERRLKQESGSKAVKPTHKISDIKILSTTNIRKSFTLEERMEKFNKYFPKNIPHDKSKA